MRRGREAKGVEAHDPFVRHEDVATVDATNRCGLHPCELDGVCPCSCVQDRFSTRKGRATLAL